MEENKQALNLTFGQEQKPTEVTISDLFQLLLSIKADIAEIKNQLVHKKQADEPEVTLQTTQRQRHCLYYKTGHHLKAKKLLAATVKELIRRD